MIKRALRLGLGLLLAALFLAAPASGQQEQLPNATDTAEQSILQVQRNNLRQMQSDVGAAGAALPEMAQELRSAVRELNPYLNTLVRLQGMVRSSLRESVIIHRNLQRLESELQSAAEPLREAKREISGIGAKLREQRERIRQQQTLPPGIRPRADFAGFLQDIDRTLARVESRLRTIDQALEPAQAFQSRIAELKEKIRKQWKQVWKSYYLEPAPSFLFTPLQQWRSQIELWWQDFPVYFRYFLLGSIDWQIFSTHLGLFFGLFLAALVLTGIRLRKHYPQVLLHRESLACISISLALAIVATYITTNVNYQSVVFNTLFQVVLAWGLVRLFWKVRCVQRGLSPRSHNPLLILWAVFTLALVLQNFDLPAVYLQALWVLIILAAFVWSLRGGITIESSLEKYLHALSLPVLPGLGLLAAAGWVHLALLLGALWFVFCLCLQLGNLASFILKTKVRALPETSLGYILQGAVQGLGTPLIWLAAFSVIVLWLGFNLGSFRFLDALAGLQIGWGKISVNLVRLILVFAGIYLVRSGLTMLTSILGRFSRTQEQIESGTVSTLQILMVYIVWALYGLIALAVLGVNLTSLTVIAGGLSVGIGFGLQSIINNFVSGLILLFGRSIKPGDVVQLGDMWAQVKQINIRTTVVETFDRSTILLPNAQLISERIINWTHTDRIIRRRIGVRVAYGSDTDLVRELMEGAAREHPRVLRYPEPFVRFGEFGESSLDFVLYFYSTIEFGWMVESDLRFEIDRAFRANDVEIAFPQRDLHIRSARGLAESGGPGSWAPGGAT
jgi:small-conductance mechanosensitive channel